MDRRKFLKAISAGAAALGLAGGREQAQAQTEDQSGDRVMTGRFTCKPPTGYVPPLAPDDYIPPEVPGTGRPADFLPGGPRGDGTVFAPYVVGEDGVKEFRLIASDINWEVAPGVVKQGLAFNGTIPGPTIRVNQGDPIRIVVQNNLKEETVVHWHGMILPNAMDGVSPLTQKAIPPGGNFTYEYIAEAPGTHWYHSHTSGDQVGMGLHGSLEVLPRSGEYAVDRDYRLFIGDTNLGLVINGKTYPFTAPLRTMVGERVRIRMTVTGEMAHPFHLHGQPFQVVAQDGFPLPQPQWMDTLLIATAQTFDIIAPALVPGKWVFHCHIFSHMHAMIGGKHRMTGLVTIFDVAPPDRLVANPALPPPGVQLPPLAPNQSAVPGVTPPEEGKEGVPSPENLRRPTRPKAP